MKRRQRINEPPEVIFQFKVGDRVRNLMNRQEGIIKDRWPVRVSLEDDLDESILYEIETDAGDKFAEYEENLSRLRSVSRREVGERTTERVTISG